MYFLKVKPLFINIFCFPEHASKKIKGVRICREKFIWSMKSTLLFRNDASTVLINKKNSIKLDLALLSVVVAIRYVEMASIDIV